MPHEPRLSDRGRPSPAISPSGIDTNPNLIFVKDWEGKYVLANEAMAQFHGTTVETLIGKRDSDFGLKDGEIEQFLRADREVISTQLATFIPEEQATCTRTGETRWFQTVKVPLLSPDGSARQVLACRPTSPSASSWRINSARPTRWKRSAGWPAASLTTSTTC